MTGRSFRPLILPFLLVLLFLPLRFSKRFFCVQSFRLVQLKQPLSFAFSDPFSTLVSTMNDNTILARQMVAATAATRKYVASEGF